MAIGRCINAEKCIKDDFRCDHKYIHTIGSCKNPMPGIPENHRCYQAICLAKLENKQNDETQM
jgi:hypothetical protein